MHGFSFLRPERENSTVDVDPSVAEQHQAARRYRLNVVRIPSLRLVGFSFVLLFVVLYDRFVAHSHSVATLAALGALFFAYCTLSWLALRLFYARLERVDLAFVFLAFDMVLWTVALYFAGA